MRSFWLIAKHEYLKLVGKRSFLIGTLGFPLIIGVVMAIGIIVAVGGDEERPLGVVDHANVMNPAVMPLLAEDEEPLSLLYFNDETAARAALSSGEIQAFFIIPAGYPANLQTELYYWQEPLGNSIWLRFDDYLRANLAQQYPAGVQPRLLESPSLAVRAADGSREFSEQNIFNFFIPFIVAFFFLFVVMGSSGYLLQVVTDEKENRTMEVMITTVSPGQLIGGKALGLLAVSFTQVAIWVLAGVTAVLIGAQFVEFLQGVQIPWLLFGLIVLFFVPAYALVAGMMTAIGSAVTELQQGQQIAGILNLLFLLPFFFIALFLAAPDSPILMFMTFFPTTSFITVLLRWGMSTIPAWQIVVSWLILTASALFSIWASARIFRVGMLRYGQSMSLRDTVAAVRERSVRHA
jgi:ABC-2 type transport system permease protein